MTVPYPKPHFIMTVPYPALEISYSHLLFSNLRDITLLFLTGTGVEPSYPAIITPVSAGLTQNLNLKTNLPKSRDFKSSRQLLLSAECFC